MVLPELVAQSLSPAAMAVLIPVPVMVVLAVIFNSFPVLAAVQPEVLPVRAGN